MRYSAGTIHRIGQTIHHVRRAMGHVDRGMRVARAVHDAVRPHVGSNKITAAAEKGLTSYEAIREKIKQGTGV